MTTRAPRCSSALAVAYQMPRAAPVIAMVLPWMLSMRPNFTPVKFWRKACVRLSVGRCSVERMFESEFAGVDDAAVVAAIAEGARAEAVAGARRLAAIAELKRRRVLDDDERARWACDGWDCAAAEVAAAMNVNSRRASGQMRQAVALRDHLPAVAAMFARGELSARVVGAITWRTQFITEESVWAVIDRAIADRAAKWGPLAEDKLTCAVDALVLEFDASALMVSKTMARSCDFVVGDLEDEAGTTSVWGRLNSADALVLKKKIAAMVAAVCENDPRSAGERRAAALGA